MDIQKIFQALDEDSQNSALGIMCRELEAQGYSVAINGKQVTADGIFEGKHGDIENKLSVLNITLYRNGVTEQEFALEFEDFHEPVFKRAVS